MGGVVFKDRIRNGYSSESNQGGEYLIYLSVR